MTTKTKKRWHVGCGNGEGSVFADEGRMALGPRGTTLTPICTVYDFEGDREENLALIAVAPELAEVLEEIVSRNEIQGWFNLDAARAVLAKLKPANR